MKPIGSLRRIGAIAAAVMAAGALLAASPALSQQQGKLKVGLMLPYTGTYAALGNAITNGFKLAVEENGGKLGGPRDRVLRRRRRVRSGEGAREREQAHQARQRRRAWSARCTRASRSRCRRSRATTTRCSSSRTPAPTTSPGPLCAANVFRTSFSNSQLGIAMGKVMADQKKKTAVTITWKYAAGEESIGGFKESFEAGGGKVVKELFLPFPQVEFQPLLTEIASLKPDVVYAFFAGGGAVKFVKDYAAAGLNKTIPLVGPGFLTDGTLEAQGEAAQGMLTTLHYADGLNNPKNNAFRAAYMKAYKAEPDVYAVQGYDAAQLLIVGMNAVKGDTSKRAELVKAMEGGEARQPARPAGAHQGRTTRSTTSTCARSRARRTSTSASRSRT